MNAKDRIRQMMREAAASPLDATDPASAFLQAAMGMGMGEAFLGMLPDEDAACNAAIASFAGFVNSLRSDWPQREDVAIAAGELYGLAGELESVARESDDPEAFGIGQAVDAMRHRAGELEGMAVAAVAPASPAELDSLELRVIDAADTAEQLAAVIAGELRALALELRTGGDHAAAGALERRAASWTNGAGGPPPPIRRELEAPPA